jgi:hypothetical protein
MTDRTRMLSAAATLAALVAAAPALAQMTDADGDGMYTLEDLLAAYPDLGSETFDEIDTDGDGMLSEAEVAAAQEGGLLPEAG